MDQKELGSLLQKLDQELRAADRIDPGNRELIQRLSDDIRPILASKKAMPEHYVGLRDRLADSLAAFEAEHPRLATAMENVINQLARWNL